MMDVDFDPSFFGPAVAAVLSPLPLMPLGPGKPNADLRPALQAIDLPPACRAGLWLVHDFQTESHDIAQDLHTAEGSYWHAIQHRREPDAGNAKYWLRRIGVHPIHADLKLAATEAGYANWSPERFVDDCERHRDTGTPTEALLRQVQMLEWRLLFHWCCERGM